jgi:hypothetical protein
MRKIFEILVSIGFFFLIFRLIAYWQKKENEKLKQAAVELGFQFESGADQEIRIPYVPDFLKPLFTFAKSESSWKMTGVVDGIPIVVYPVVRGSGKNKRSYTVVEASYRKAPPSSFKITREGFFSKIGKAVFHMQDIQIGNPEFDRRVAIKGSDPFRLVRLLSHPALQKGILDALDFHSGIMITEAGVHFEQREILTDVTRYREILQRLCVVALEMDKAFQTSGSGWTH